MGSYPALTIALALMVILAGCGSPIDSRGSQVNEAEPTEITTESQVSPQDTKTTNESAATGTSNTTNESATTETIDGIKFYNMTPKKAQKIEGVMVGFYSELPSNESERLKETEEIANATCKEGEKIDHRVFENSSEANRQLYRVKHAAETIQNFNNDIHPAKVQRAIEVTGDIGRYATVIGAYNEFYEASCAFDRNDPDTVEDYYIATAALGVEIALIQYGVYYKTSSKAARALSHTDTFRMVQAKFGDDALRILMSESHWAVRGSINGVNQFVADKLKEENVTVEEKGINKTDFRERLNRTDRLENKSEVEEEVATVADDVDNTTKSLIDRFKNSSFDEKEKCLKNLEGSYLGAAKDILAKLWEKEEISKDDLGELSESNQDSLRRCLESE